MSAKRMLSLLLSFESASLIMQFVYWQIQQQKLFFSKLTRQGPFRSAILDSASVHRHMREEFK